MAGQLDGQVCVVTGASRGIGKAIAERLAREGARIVVHYGRNRDMAEQVAEGLAGSGHVAIGANLEAVREAASFIEQAAAEAGRIDVLVNNAGIYKSHPPMTSSSDDWLESWERTLAVNLVSPAAMCHAAARLMAGEGGGRIINIGSRGAFRGEPEGPAYAASKAGLHALSQTLAKALAPENILVFAIAPAFVGTDMATSLLEGPEGDSIRAQSPLNRVGTPEEIADVACYLAATEAAFMTGAIIDVNGASYLRS